MGVLSNLRGSRAPPQGGLPTSDGLSSASASSAPAPFKMKWSSFLPIFVALVVLAEIAFLGRLHHGKNGAMLDTMADILFPHNDLVVGNDDSGSGFTGSDRNQRAAELDKCEEFLEREDGVVYSRDFNKTPIFVSGGEKEWKTCAVGCHFGYDSDKAADAAFGAPQERGGVPSILRSMESAQYYSENNVALARRKGYSIIMTTSLSSDVPVGYFSWAEYDIMAPLQPKTENALAAAFISNCGARNFRLQALVELEKAGIRIDSYGGCHRNRDGSAVNKVEALKRYRFSLAFENSNEEDYVTEKFFQSLVAGAIPVVVGAPNIQEYAPASDSILHIKELEDVGKIAKTMKYLAENPDAFNHSLRWKYEGPSDSFKALIDMAAVHSSCRLCIHLATRIREKEETSPGFKQRRCKCSTGAETVYHLYVRERGRFEAESIFLRSGDLTLKALEFEVLKKFKSMKHVPIWKQERPESIRGGDDEYRVYRIYPVGMTQRQALYTFRFNEDSDLKNHLEANPCAKFEVIFV